MRLSIPVISFFIFFCGTFGALAQPGLETSTPIAIEADRLESSQEQSSVVFSGNVQANQGDLIINADEMTVFYTRTAIQQASPPAENTAPQARKIDKIMARGNVKIVQGDRVAAGDTMDFNADDRIVILSGNAKAWQDQNMISGEKIVLYLDEGKSVVEKSGSEGERVRAFIYPSSQEKNGSENR